MYKLIAGMLAVALLAGCVTSQGRDNPNRDLLTGVDVGYETRRHGGVGLELATLWNTGDVADARGDYTGRRQGLQADEFYHVEIAPDPLRPSVLTSAGYIRRLQEDRGDLFLYEFYDDNWNRIALLGADGSLYRHVGGKEEYLGKHQLDAAVFTLYPAPSGYGYDSYLQDDKLVKTWDPEVNAAPERARGVFHRTHTSAPPVIVYTRLGAGESRRLAEHYTYERAAEREAQLLNRLREERHGGFGVDERYGGIQYRDGNPVDDDGRPLRPAGRGK